MLIKLTGEMKPIFFVLFLGSRQEAQLGEVEKTYRGNKTSSFNFFGWRWKAWQGAVDKTYRRNKTNSLHFLCWRQEAWQGSVDKTYWRNKIYTFNYLQLTLPSDTVRVINSDYICAKLNSVQQSVNIKAFWSQDTHLIIQANIKKKKK